MGYVLLAVAFALLLGGALVFTNAIEWAGHKLDVGQGAVGSILAAVATALPESAIPIVALVTGSSGSEQVAIGSILGAPFVLGTLAMLLVGVAALGFKERRDQDDRLEPHRETLTRDLVFFLAVFGGALALGVADPPQWLRWACAGLFVAAYVGYLVWSLGHGGETEEEDELRPLYFDLTKSDPPRKLELVPQLVVGIGMIVYGAHLFVAELESLSERIGIAPLVLALVIAPLATELPEKVNSVLWVRRGKDALALGNITGAMVFQAAIPVAVGLAFTDWNLGRDAVLASSFALAGGALALWAARRRGRFGPVPIAVWGALFATFVAFAFATSG